MNEQSGKCKVGPKTVPQTPERKHTPLPWKLSTLSKLHGEYRLYTGENVNCADEIIADIAGGLGTYDAGCCESKGNAEFIVLAVNSYYKLRDALENTARELSDMIAAIADQGITERFIDDSCNMISQSESAIEAASAALVAE